MDIRNFVAYTLPEDVSVSVRVSEV